jgi:hypothetical protein
MNGLLLHVIAMQLTLTAPRVIMGGNMNSAELTTALARADCDIARRCDPKRAAEQCRQADRAERAERKQRKNISRMKITLQKQDWILCRDAVLGDLTARCTPSTRFGNVAEAEPACEAYRDFLFNRAR